MPVFTVPCLNFFTEVNLENVEVLLSSVEYRVAQLEAMLKPQQLWDPAGYTACNYNTPAHWRNTGFQDSYSPYQDTSRLSSYGALRYPSPSFCRFSNLHHTCWNLPHVFLSLQYLDHHFHWQCLHLLFHHQQCLRMFIHQQGLQHY